MDEFEFEDELLEEEAIEGYCVRCRESVEMETPQAVWTRKGMPATRGECPICGGAVFRMGKTHAHARLTRPAAIEVGETGKRKQPQLSKDTVYVNYAPGDAEFAQSLADDLNKAGIAAWLHDSGDSTQWAGGIHPALKDCDRMVFVLSAEALATPDVEAAWKLFKERRKPVIIAQRETAQTPDSIRRSPRFDFSRDYKGAFRQMLQALSS